MEQTPQETFWQGEFGTKYQNRNAATEVSINRRMLGLMRMMRCAHSVSSLIEFGCNIGINLAALAKLKPEIKLKAFEINQTAISEAQKLQVAEIHNESFISEIKTNPADMTFSSGVLIHIHPNDLQKAYKNLYQCSNRYILISEYYNPTPIDVNYRGHKERLFKRDFAGEMIDQYGVKLIDYGFIYHRDGLAPHDDTNWFLLEK